MRAMRGNIAKCSSLNCFRLGGDMSGNYYGVDLQSGKHRHFRVHTTIRHHACRRLLCSGHVQARSRHRAKYVKKARQQGRPLFF
jgi:hypothetical protein